MTTVKKVNFANVIKFFKLTLISPNGVRKISYRYDVGSPGAYWQVGMADSRARARARHYLKQGWSVEAFEHRANGTKERLYIR